MFTSDSLKEKRIAAITKAEEISKLETISKEDEAKLDAFLAEADDLALKIAKAEKLEGFSRSAGRKTPAGNPSADIPEKDLRGYSLMRAVARVADNKELDGLEGEVHEEIARKAHRKCEGQFWMPNTIQMQGSGRRVAAALTTTTGAGLVENFTDTANFIDVLRSKMVLSQCGVRYINDLVGETDYPKKTTGSTAYWINNETTDLTESSVAIGQITFTPKTVGAYTEVTRKTLKSSSMSIENMLREDLAATIAHAIEVAAIAGGDTGEPSGLLTLNRFRSHGGAFDWADVVGLETDVASDNADLNQNSLCYLTHPTMKGYLKSNPKVANTSNFMWEDGEVNGYKAFATSAVANGNDTAGTPLIFGDFSQMVIATWSAIDILVNPYVNDKKGSLRITGLQDVDVKFLRDEAFKFVSVTGL